MIVAYVVLDNGNFGVLFILTYEFGLSMIMFAFILTSFFDKAKTASGLGALCVVLLSCFYYLQVFLEDVPTVTYWFISLLSPPAFAIAVDRVMIRLSIDITIPIYNFLLLDLNLTFHLDDVH